LVVFVIVCLLMILLVLMQRPKQEGLGAAFGAGVTDQVFGARTTNVLQRGTVYLASLFFLLSLTLAVLIGHQNKKTSMVASTKPAAQVAVVKPEEPVKPKSLSEELPAADKTPADSPSSTPPKDAIPTPQPDTAPATPAPEPATPATPAPEPATPAPEPAAPATPAPEPAAPATPAPEPATPAGQ
jgi:preprotein translocase subunit SecG